MTKCDVAIIGAGPYGLSAAAHLRSAKGLDVHTFGEPMSFWQQNMPVGMLLRSGWAASHIGAPQGPLTLEEYRAETSHFSTPVPLDRFVDYGLWYQRRAVPDIDRRKISRIELHPNGFKLSSRKAKTSLLVAWSWLRESLRLPGGRPSLVEFQNNWRLTRPSIADFKSSRTKECL